MSEVDERIVRMQFDNAGFEAGAAKAVETLGKLDAAMKFDGAAAGLDSVQRSMSNFNMDSVANALEESKSHFSAFEQFGIGVFRSLGNEVVQFGTKMVHNLTNSLTAGAKDGFKEYELQMGSLQTISANSGESMEVITQNLDELNEYADKTIYNFAQMTQNIGRFTAAGLGVEESTKAIKGFANMAALAGAGTQETSRGMYQLSQAMASGVVKLQDWKSIQNASIDTAAFKDILMETARVMGTDVDAAIEKQGSFNASLQEGWLTADVMAQALEVATMSTRDYADETAGMEERLKQLAEMGYSEDIAKKLIEIANSADDSAREVRTWTQLVETVKEAIGSGWANTWKLVVGDFDEATQLFTTISQRMDTIVSASANARNGMLKEWKDAGGRDALIGIFANLAEAVTRVFLPIKDAFSVVFGMGGKQLAVFTENIALFTEKLVPSTDFMNKFNSTLVDLFTIVHSIIGVFGNVVRIIFNIASGIFNAVKPFSLLMSVIEPVVGALARFANKLQVFSDRVVDAFELMGEPISDVFNDLIEVAKAFVSTFSSVFKNNPVFEAIAGQVSYIASYFSELWKTISSPDEGQYGGLISFVDKITSPLRKLHEFLTGFLTKEVPKASNLTGEALKEYRAKLNAGLIGVDNATTFFLGIFQKVSDFFGGPLKTMIDGARNILDPFMKFILDTVFVGIVETFNKITSFDPSVIADFFKSFTFPEFITNIPKKLSTFGSEFLSQAKDYAKGSKLLDNTKKTLKNFSDKILPTLSKTFVSFKNKFVDTVKTVVNYIKNLTPQNLAEDISKVIDKIVFKVKQFSPNLAEGFGKFGEKIKSAFASVTENAEGFGDVFSNIKDKLLEKVNELPPVAKSLFEQIKASFAWGKEQLMNEAGEISFENIGINFSNVGQTVGEMLSGFADGLVGIPDITGDIYDSVLTKAKEFVGQFPSLENIGDAGTLLLQGGLVASLIKLATSFTKVNESFKKIGDSVGKWPTSFEQGMRNFGEHFGKYESNADKILKVAGAIAILAGSLFILASIPGDDLMRAGKAMAVLAVGLMGSIAAFEAIMKIPFFNNPAMLTSIGVAFSGVAVGVLALAAAAWVLSKIPDEQLKSGISSLVQIMTAISLYALSMQSNGKSLLAGSIGLIFLSFALKGMIDAISILGDMDAGKLEQGLSAFTEVMIVLSIFGAIGAKGIGNLLSSVMKFGIGVAAMSLSLVILAIGLKKLSDAIKEIDNLQTTLMIAGGAIGVFAGVCLLLMKADPIGVGTAILIFSGAIMVMAMALSGLAMVDPGSALASMMMLAALILEFAAIAQNVDSDKLIEASVAMGIFSGALLVMAGACAVLSLVADKSQEIGNMLFMIGLLMGEIAAIAYLVEPDNIMAASIAMGILGVAVLIMAGAFKVLSTIDYASIEGSLNAIMGMFAVFAAVAGALSSVAAQMILVGAAFAVFAAAVFILSLAFKNFAESLNDVEEADPEKMVGFMEGFGEGLGKMLASLAKQIPNIIKSLAEGLLAGAHYLFTAAFDLIGKFGEFCMQNSTQLLLAGAEFAKMVGEGILSALSFIIDKVPVVVSAICDNFVPFMVQVLTVGKDIVVSVGQGILDALPDLKVVCGNILQTIIQGVGDLVDPLLAWAGDGIQGIINAIADHVPFLKSKSEEAEDAVVDGMASMPDKTTTTGEKAGQGVADGLSSKTSAVVTAAGGLVTTASDSIANSSLYDKFHTVGANATQGLIDGLKSKLHDVETTSSQLASASARATKATYQEKSPSKLMRGIGDFAAEGLIIGLANRIGDTYDTGVRLAQAVPNAFDAVLSAASISVDDLIDTDYSPVITPVIDPTQFDSGMGYLNNVLNNGLANIMPIGEMDYNAQFGGKLDDLLDSNRQVAATFASNSIDYTLLGTAVANALIASGVHVEMDGGELMGYLAGQIQDTRRMYS